LISASVGSFFRADEVAAGLIGSHLVAPGAAAYFQDVALAQPFEDAAAVTAPQ